MASALPIPFHRALHLICGKAIADKFVRRDRPFAQPMPAPAITRVRIGSVLEAVTAQRVQYFVLNRFNGRREVRDEMVGIGIQTDHHGLGEEFRQVVIRAPGIKDPVVDSGQELPAGCGQGRTSPARDCAFGL